MDGRATHCQAFHTYQAAYSHLSLANEHRYADLAQYIQSYADHHAQRWLTEALLTLLNAGPLSRHGAYFIIDKRIEVRITNFRWWQQGMGVRWSAAGAIEMRAERIAWDMPVRRSQLPALVHEAAHLEQGKRVALSKLGEIHAWSVEYQVWQELGLPIRHIPAEVGHWAANPTAKNFATAVNAIIKKQGYRYLLWLLPKYPHLRLTNTYIKNLAHLPTTHNWRKT